MAVSDTSSEQSNADGTAFDPRALVSRKPSSLPTIYEYVYTAGTATPREIESQLDGSPTVVQPNLSTLIDLGLIERIEHGVYGPAAIPIDPASVHALGELRSEMQYEICRIASEGGEFDVSTMNERAGSTKSNVRAAVTRLADLGFLDLRREAHRNSYKRYRLSDHGKQSLAGIDVERYRGWDGRETVAHETGIEGTAFRTAYEVEDAHYLATVDATWVHPERVATSLGKEESKTRHRFASMAERGLFDVSAEREKIVFLSTTRTRALFDDLALYTIARAYELDLYSVANDERLVDAFSIEDLYSVLARRGSNPSVSDLNRAKTDLGAAGVLDGDRLTGYYFTIGDDAGPLEKGGAATRDVRRNSRSYGR